MSSTTSFCAVLRSVLVVALLLLAQVHDTLAQNTTTTGETVVFDWNITWVRANPDGMMDRPVVGINNQWPVPVINATKGDRLVITIHNLLGNETTSLHWHGLFQNGTSGMDGPVMVSQCALQPGQSATYNFTLDQVGTYWYHSHSNGQYPDGLRGALIIQDPDSPYAGKYDEERLITLSDWYHDEIPLLLKSFISVENPTGAEPVPKSALMNDTSDFQMSMVSGRTYLLRIANIGAFASQYFWIEGHTMRIVEVDGVWVDEAETDMIYISVAQRYSVLITAKDDASTNYAIVGSMDTTLFDTIPSTLNWNVTGWLVYDDSADLPAATDVTTFAPYDDFSLVPLDGEELLSEADYTVTLDLTMNNLGDGANYAMFNDISFVYPKVPVLYTALSAGELATNPTIYGKDSPAYVLGYGEIIDIVLNNDDTGRHPFHLHGHVFQVIHRSEEDAGHFNASGVTFPSVPMKRDTLVVQPSGNFVIRFKADNPATNCAQGVWFFHCHIEWHLASGLAVTFVEAPLELQQNQEIPNGFADICWDQGIETVGNAAGNSEDWLDLTGQNMEVTPLPPGFTTKGYVAMAFSCFAGFLGMASIAWYGLAPIAQN